MSRLCDIERQLTPSSQPYAQLNQFANAPQQYDSYQHSEKQSKASTHENVNASVDEPSTIPESVEPYQTPDTSPATRPPRLSTSRSAPAAEMEPMVQSHSTPSQKAFSTFTKAISFSYGGDTQEFTSQEYRDSMRYSISRPSDITPGTAQKTQKQGDEGYIDLEAYTSSQQGFEEGFLQETQTPETQARETQFRVPEKPVPQTPAVSGDRQGSDSELPTSVATKSGPRFSQIFGPAPSITSPSKLFNQTQQPSSPGVGLPHSDPLDQRPSPNANDISSTPQKCFSSPELGKELRPFTAPGQPRDYYVTMLESQNLRDQRAARLKMNQTGDDAEDEWFEEESINTKRQRVRRTLSENALQVTAPARPGSRRRTSRKSRDSIYDVPDSPNPAKRQKVQFETIDDEEQAEEPDVEQDDEPEKPDEMDEPRHEDEYGDNEGNSVQEDLDEYDEFGQTLRSQANDPDEMNDASTVASVEHNDPERDDQELDDVEEVEMVQDQQHNGQNTQRSTIADSQPDVQRARSQGAVIQHVQHSSFVPGSQHAGKTSEDQALLASSQRRSQLRVAASQVDREDSNDAERIPSSPPLLGISNAMPEDSVETSLPEQDLPQSARKSSTAPREIPESDLPDADASKPDTTGDENEDDETQDTGRDAAPFSTARTHVSGSVQSPARRSNVPSPRKPTQSQRSQLTEPSPRKLAGVRTFADMATNEASTYGSLKLEADVDDVIQGIITEEDQQVWDKTSDQDDIGRSSKRRKISRTASSEVAEQRRVTREHSEVDVQIDEDTVEEANGTIAESEHEVARPESPPQALRDSPNKANKMLPPVQKGDVKAAADEKISESVMLREKAGSDAVSQLVRSRGNATTKTTKQMTYGRGSRRKSSRSERESTKNARQAESPVDEDDAKDVVEPAAVQDENDAADEPTDPNIDESTTAMDAEPTDVATPVEQVEEKNGETAQDDSTLVPNPKRVFALFKGTPLAFYPATWLGATPDGESFRIRFDDGTETQVEAQHVRALDLRVDDNVRVDVPGLRNKSWHITGFGAPAQTREERGLGTDVNGHIRIKVQAKSTRKSLSNDASDEDRDVLVDRIYLTNTMWPAYNDRVFTPPTKSRAERSQTPLAHLGTPSSEAPPSRSQRAIVPTAKAKGSGLRLSHRRETSTSSARNTHSNGIFAGMAFAITYVSNEAEKSDVTRLISRHGGTILDGGFEELFELPKIGKPSGKSPKKSTIKQVEEAETGLRLKAEYKDLGFIALIADKHSRRAKYMQSLALGLPTLSGRWVMDSLDAAKNDTLVEDSVNPLPWDRYLLPAGESAYLGGAVRSRTLAPYDIASADLQATISARTMLLDGESVLIVAPKKDKAGWEKRRTYAFLTLALGAGQVKRVYDLDEAKALIEQDPESPKWLYVDGSVAKAESALFDKTGTGKKRKRGADVVSNKSSAAQGNVRIVDDEFVVQSLILGALYE